MSQRQSRRAGLDRRHLMRLGLAIPPALVVAGCTDGEAERAAPGGTGTSTAPTPSGTLPPTPACADADEETVAQTEGPFFTPGSPERTRLRGPGMRGPSLTVTGLVVDTRCRPAARALLDFWQADAEGEYDNSGFRLRGHQFTGPDGSYRLETVLPGLYTGRTRHVHVKAQLANGPVLTTQLYFPGERRNADDGIFDEALLVRDYRRDGDAHTASFTFVLRG